MAKDEKTENDNTSSGGNTDGVVANSSAPINATTNKAENASGMERSLPADEQHSEPEKTASRDYQKEAAREVLRMLGFQDPEATHAAMATAAGGHVPPAKAAISGIVNTNADDVLNNNKLVEKIQGALSFHNPQHLQAFQNAIAAVDAARTRGEIVELTHKEVVTVPPQESAQLARVTTGPAQEPQAETSRGAGLFT